MWSIGRRSIEDSMKRDNIFFAAAQLQGKRDFQEDYFLNYNDECIAVADGVGGMPHGDVAAKLACETAIWGYKQIRLRNTYWKDRRLLMKRIFRTVNITLCQKQHEEGFSDGMATTMTIAIVASRSVWIGSAGDTPAYYFHEGQLQKITHDDIDAGGNLTKAIGTQRYGLVPEIHLLDFEEGDAVLVTSDGVSRYVPESDMQKILTTDAVVALLQLAEKNGGRDNMTACLVKRIRN